MCCIYCSFLKSMKVKSFWKALQIKNGIEKQAVFQFISLQVEEFMMNKTPKFQRSSQRIQAHWPAVLGLSKRKTIPMWSHCWIPIPIGFIFHDWISKVQICSALANAKISYFPDKTVSVSVLIRTQFWCVVQQSNLDHAMFSISML